MNYAIITQISHSNIKWYIKERQMDRWINKWSSKYVLMLSHCACLGKRLRRRQWCWQVQELHRCVWFTSTTASVELLYKRNWCAATTAVQAQVMIVGVWALLGTASTSPVMQRTRCIGVECGGVSTRTVMQRNRCSPAILIGALALAQLITRHMNGPSGLSKCVLLLYYMQTPAGACVLLAWGNKPSLCKCQ